MPALPFVLRSPLRAVVFAVALLLPVGLRAQDTTSTANLRPTSGTRIVQLVLTDGSRLVGQVIEVTPTTIRFASQFGETVIPRAVVAKVNESDADASHQGEFWPEDPSRTRLFFAPTARMLRQGEAYFADAYIFFPSMQYGITDALSIGAGLSLIPGLGIDRQLYYITPKLAVYSAPRAQLSVGALIAGGRLFDQNPFGIGYAVGTFGGEDGSLTTGIGYGFSGGTTSSSAVLLLGGSQRVSRGLALVTENYLFTGRNSTSLLSGGLRMMGEKLSVDFAAFIAPTTSTTIVPYVAFVYKY